MEAVLLPFVEAFSSLFNRILKSSKGQNFDCTNGTLHFLANLKLP